MNYESLKALADANFEWPVQLRRTLHRIPESGFQEFMTQKTICDTLDALGIPYTTHRTWVVGLIEGAKPGKTIALRADMDGLPVTEPLSCPFRSEHEGWMHACGHDGHMAIQLGTARILASMKDRLCGNVKLLFQPAEETDGGAKPMVEAGVLENPHVDACYGLHLMSRLPLGTIETRQGTLNASTDEISIEIIGHSGHAAYPESGVDAIVCAAQLISALQTLVSRNVSPIVGAVLTFGKISGGSARNIICDSVKMEGTLRTADPELRHELQERIREMSANIAAAFGAEAKVEIIEGYSPLVNHDREAKLVLNLASELFGENKVILKDAPSMGGEDFSYFIEDTPGAFYHIGCTPEEKMPGAALHNPGFSPDEECLRQGLMMQTGIVLREMGIEL